MYIDQLATFCSATAASGTGVSQLVGNVMDTHVLMSIGTAGPTDFNTLLGNAGDGKLLWVVQVQTSYSGGTSAEYQFASADNAALSTNRTVHIDTGAIAVASLVAPTPGSTTGFTRAFVVPPDVTYRRYLGVWLTTVGATTLGKINSFLTTDVRRWIAYADAIV